MGSKIITKNSSFVCKRRIYASKPTRTIYHAKLYIWPRPYVTVIRIPMPQESASVKPISDSRTVSPELRNYEAIDCLINDMFICRLWTQFLVSLLFTATKMRKGGVTFSLCWKRFWADIVMSHCYDRLMSYESKFHFFDESVALKFQDKRLRSSRDVYVESLVYHYKTNNPSIINQLAYEDHIRYRFNSRRIQYDEFVKKRLQSSRVVWAKGRGYHHESDEPLKTKSRHTQCKNSRTRNYTRRSINHGRIWTRTHFFFFNIVYVYLLHIYMSCDVWHKTQPIISKFYLIP